jgi:glycosyltransferase involved in cell wall biosynthesis
MAESLWATYPVPENLPPVVIGDPSLPLVSIVTPSYNQGRFIRETIESVLTQDYPNIEYWVIDGGSTDKTVDVLREYEHDLRFHWISEPDKGQSDAINKGWSRCRGDVLAWLCSDDVYCPGAFRTQLSFLQAHPEVDAVYADSIFVTENGSPVWTFRARKFSQYELLRANIISQPTIFLRRSLVERTGPLNIHLHFAMDYDYWLRASVHSVFSYVPGVVAKYRLHSDSKTVAKAAQFFPEFETLVEQFFQREDISPELRRQRETIYADFMLLIGTSYAKLGQITGATDYLRKSLRYRLLRPRLLWWFVYVLEATTRIRFSTMLVENWLRLRSKF